MKELSLVIKAIHEDHAIKLLSPSIGRIELFFAVGDVVSPHQHIGYLWRLETRYKLILDAECGGVIAGKNEQNRIMHRAYLQPFLILEKHKDVEDKKNKPIKNQPGHFITASMDGLFYLSSAPSEPPYVKIGDTIAPGQTIGLIEVMKSFYPVKYEGNKAAVITDIIVTTATPVSSGTRLFATKS